MNKKTIKHEELVFKLKNKMETITFDKLLLKSVFCCMASDGKIDQREIALIKSMCQKSPLFVNFNFQEEINTLVNEINKNGKEFISKYLNLLDKSSLIESEELTLINFAIQKIKADEQIEYAEIKFFKNIRHRLKITDEKILTIYPDIEQFLEKDLITKSFLDLTSYDFLNDIKLLKIDLDEEKE